MKKQISKFIKYLLNQRKIRFYRKSYKGLLKRNNLPNFKCPGEDKWIAKWSAFGTPDPVFYRLFYPYIGEDVNILPEDFCSAYIEPILNPRAYVTYYSDKNVFDKLLPAGSLPKTILRKINGFYYTPNYTTINISTTEEVVKLLDASSITKIVIKPSIDTSSGKGVCFFEKVNDEWKNLENNEPLTLDFLNKRCGNHFIIQECLKQSNELNYYNSTSINTLRLSLYRSVTTNECHITNSIIRIGSKGSLVDNAHAGGAYVGIMQDGTLCKQVLNQYGETTTYFNDIDFTQTHIIPNFDKVVAFAKMIGGKLPHLRLLALDIMIDDSGNPRLIEFNSSGYSMWLFQFTTSSALGEYTDEVIEYCKSNINNYSIRILLK